jgi:hypothetical protein
MASPIAKPHPSKEISRKVDPLPWRQSTFGTNSPARIPIQPPYASSTWPPWRPSWCAGTPFFSGRSSRPTAGTIPAEGDIAEWFRCWPDANIEIVTGEISNLIVLDVDSKHSGDASLERLQRRFGAPRALNQTGQQRAAPPKRAVLNSSPEHWRKNVIARKSVPAL